MEYWLDYRCSGTLSVWPDLPGQTATGPQDLVGLARWQDQQFQPGTQPITGKHRYEQKAVTLYSSLGRHTFKLAQWQTIKLCTVLDTMWAKIKQPQINGTRSASYVLM